MGVRRPVNRVRGMLESVNCDGRLGLALLASCLFLLLPVLGGEAARLGLRYERLGLAEGQLWRLLTGHWVHLNLRHALVNVLGFALLWALFARDYGVRQWLCVIGAAVLAIDAGLWLRDSTVQGYVGASGVLHRHHGGRHRGAPGSAAEAGELAAGRAARRQAALRAALRAAAVLGQHAAVVVDAHLYGVIGGAATALALRARALPL